MEPMTTLITSLTAVGTMIIGYIGDIATEVVAQPVLLLGIGAGMLFAGAGLVKKFM
jgi:hypothetical protein